MVFLSLFAVALVPAIVGWVWFGGITWKEFALHLAAIAMVAGISAAIIYHRDTSDTEILNGVVTSKESRHVSCSHSYDCNCRQKCTWTTRNKRRVRDCRRVCDTCYEHSYDIDWVVQGSTGESWQLARIDRQGVGQPPRWAFTVIGEPTAQTHSFENYIKAAPDSLFRRHGLVEKYKGVLPPYPSGIYDYWHLNRMVQVGVNLPDLREWNKALMELNGRVGPKKQVNLIVVVTSKPRDYFYALEEAWMGGKKNDAILVIGLQGSEVSWTEVMAWTVNKKFEIGLESRVADMKTLKREDVVAALELEVMGKYKRKPMHDFEYLQASIVPTTTELVVSAIIALLVSIGLIFLFHHHDVFQEERRYY